MMLAITYIVCCDYFHYALLIFIKLLLLSDEKVEVVNQCNALFPNVNQIYFAHKVEETCFQKMTTDLEWSSAASLAY